MRSHAFLARAGLLLVAVAPACTDDDRPFDARGSLDAGPASEAGPSSRPDAQPPVDAQLVLDAAWDAAVDPLCRVPSWAACGITSTRDAASLFSGCPAERPVYCGARVGDAGTGPGCVADFLNECDLTVGTFGPYDCQTTADCPSGYLCSGDFTINSRPDSTSCVPDCGPRLRYQLCSSDCECGPGSLCTTVRVHYATTKACSTPDNYP